MIYYAVTEGGHPFNGKWLKIDLPTVGMHNMRIITDKGVVEAYDPYFSSFGSFRLFYGGRKDWYQRFFKKVDAPEPSTIVVARRAWDVLQEYANEASILSILNPRGEDIMAKRKTKTKDTPPETTAQALDQGSTTADGHKARQVADRKVVTVKIDKEYDAENGKVAKQAIAILTSLKELGGESNKQDLLTKMGEHVTSVQSMTKIFQHYRAVLLEKKLISITETDPPKTEDLQDAA